jgi:hypothetical protein
VYQLRSVDFSPCLDQTLLWFRQATAQTLERIDREYCRVFLIIGVEVRTVVLTARFDEHSDDDTEESREFWHS